MIGLVMAGGKGTRMNLDDEKLLLKFKKPVILHVIDSLKNSNSFSKILAATSCNSPKTKKLLEANNIETFDTSGIGYVEDLNSTLKNKFLTALGLESDFSVDFDGQTCHYTGISLVNSKKISSLENLDENYIIIDDKRIAFNLNSKQDYDLLGTA
jgi:adenosylcobinamide-phosphate guanylyltransferase